MKCYPSFSVFEEPYPDFFNPICLDFSLGKAALRIAARVNEHMHTRECAHTHTHTPQHMLCQLMS